MPITKKNFLIIHNNNSNKNVGIYNIFNATSGFIYYNYNYNSKNNVIQKKV